MEQLLLLLAVVVVGQQDDMIANTCMSPNACRPRISFVSPSQHEVVEIDQNENFLELVVDVHPRIEGRLRFHGNHFDAIEFSYPSVNSVTLSPIQPGNHQENPSEDSKVDRESWSFDNKDDRTGEEPGPCELVAGVGDQEQNRPQARHPCEDLGK